MGRLLASWIVNGKPDMDVTGINIDRLQRYQSNPLYRSHRVVESLGMVYKCHYPTFTNTTARDAKKSPFYDRMAGHGASFRDISGWEAPDWFAGEGVEPDPGPYSFGRQAWFPHWQEEHEACRNGVIVMDMSFMSKFLVQGKDAGRCLNHIAANQVDGEAGLITYTQFLNSTGHMEADVTVVKIDQERFMVVATDTAHRHVETWLRRHIPADAHAFVTDVTSGWAQLNVQGPLSRQLMASLTSEDMSDEAFPFRTSREIDLGYARPICNRITYVGELGYELIIPTEQALHVYDHVVKAGEAYGLKHAGLKALASLRLEKGYRDYGHDMDNTDTILEVGLGFCVDYDKPDGFIGKEAVVAQKAQGTLHKRMVQVLVKDPAPFLHHGEVILRDGVPMGDVRAGSYGHTLGGAVGLTMIEAETKITKRFLEEGVWEVEIAGSRYPIELSLQPMYDPKNQRIKM